MADDTSGPEALAMRTTLITVLLLFLAPGAHAESAPDFATVSAGGETIKLSEEVREQTTVLFFWASWCPYCKALMPHLESIRLEYGDDVEILAIHFRDDADGARYIADAGYGFTVIPDGDAIAKRYGVHSTPGLVIPDESLTVRFDLRELQRRPLPQDAETHTQKAAFRAPFWAAEIRQAIDAVEAGGQ